MHIIVSHWNSYIVALAFYFVRYENCQKIEESTTYENITARIKGVFV